jgi:glycosyltransferase involved in cell wall biosynthesis
MRNKSQASPMHRIKPALVSVIIPTYNRAAYLGDAIRSAQTQTYPHVEIIVADDGSTDSTAEVAAQFTNAITYVSLPHRGQPAATRNGGLRVASGEFVAFLDSDDLFFPHKLALQVAALEACPEVGMAYSDGCFFRDEPSLPTGRVQDGLPRPSGNIFADLLRGNMLAPPVVLIRRSCLDRAGEFDENPDFCAVEDYDLWLRIAAQFQVCYVAGEVAAIRRHRQSISYDMATLRSRTLKVLAKMEALYPDLMKQHHVARHEAYARNHGAVALAEFQQAHLGLGVWHGWLSLVHTLQLPGLGIGSFRAWQQRRHQRWGARP